MNTETVTNQVNPLLFTLPPGGRHKIVRLRNSAKDLSFEEAVREAGASGNPPDPRHGYYPHVLVSSFESRREEGQKPPSELLLVNFGVGSLKSGPEVSEWAASFELKKSNIKDVCYAAGQIGDLRDVFGAEIVGLIATQTQLTGGSRHHAAYVRRIFRRQYVGHDVFDRKWDGQIWWFAFAV